MPNIRPQYHFRHVDGEVLIWDVRKLVQLSGDLPLIAVELSTIEELRENYWYQDLKSTPTCLSLIEHFQLIEAADLEFPVILDQSGRVMDGMHRVCKAFMLGHSKIPAVRFSKDPEPHFRNVSPRDLAYD